MLKLLLIGLLAFYFASVSAYANENGTPEKVKTENGHLKGKDLLSHVALP